MFKAISPIIDQHRGDLDHAGRFGFNTVFGDKVVATRSADIAVMFNYGLSAFDVKTTGTVASSDGVAIVSTTASSGTSSVLESVHNVQYFPGDEMFAYFTAAFTQGVNGSSQYIAFESITDGFRLGYTDDIFGITYYRDSTVHQFIPRSQFDGDISHIDVTKLNIYRISLGYLGISPITFEVYGGKETGWVVIETIDVSNSQITASVTNPVFKIRAKVENTTNDTDIKLYTASWRAGTIGTHPRKGKYFDYIGEKLAITSGAIFTIKSKTTFNSLTNFVPTSLTSLSVATDGTKIFKVTLIKNATLGGTPSYSDIYTNESTIEVDSAGTTVTGGTNELQVGAAKVDNLFIDLDAQNIHLHPGDTLTIKVDTSVAGDVVISLRWRELF